MNDKIVYFMLSYTGNSTLKHFDGAKLHKTIKLYLNFK